MSAKPSRTELETALAGHAKASAHKKPQTSNPIELQLDSMTARRQKVIGGDLTGAKPSAKRRLGENPTRETAPQSLSGSKKLR